MVDSGKRLMTPEEENPDTRANKKRTRVTHDKANPETFDPSYHGLPPASMQFPDQESGFALIPLPAMVYIKSNSEVKQIHPEVHSEEAFTRSLRTPSTFSAS